MCPKEEQQKVTTKPARKREKKMSARHAEPRCLGPKPRLCGWKKSGPGRVCRSWGPKKPSAAKRDQYGIACLDGPSEIRAGSLGT